MEKADPADAVRAAFRRQAEACQLLGSPFTARLCTMASHRLNHSTAVGQRVLSWPGRPVPDALALRLAGGLHALARGGAIPQLTAVYPPHAVDGDTLSAAFEAALHDGERTLHAYLDRPPQTNEVKRCSPLLGGLMYVAEETALPIALLEIGSSAGLNLNIDRFRYIVGAEKFGDPASQVIIRSEWRGAPRVARRVPAIITRAGCDLLPIDVDAPRERERLISYIWPDQRERLAVTQAALAMAQAAVWRVEQSDAADWIEARLAGHSEPGVTRVLMHSIVWQYLPPETQSRVRAALSAAGQRTTPQLPLAWLRLEPASGRDAAALTLTLWRGGDPSERVLALADYHGRWVDWL